MYDVITLGGLGAGPLLGPAYQPLFSWQDQFNSLPLLVSVINLARLVLLCFYAGGFSFFREGYVVFVIGEHKEWAAGL